MIWKRSENDQKGEQDVFVHKAQKKNERLFALISERRNQNWKLKQAEQTSNINNISFLFYLFMLSVETFHFWVNFKSSND